MNMSARCLRTVLQRLIVVLVVVVLIGYKVFLSPSVDEAHMREALRGFSGYGSDVHTEETRAALPTNETYSLSNKYLTIQLHVKPEGPFGRVVHYGALHNHIAATTPSPFSPLAAASSPLAPPAPLYIHPHLFVLGFEEIPIINSSKCRLEEIGLLKYTIPTPSSSFPSSSSSSSTTTLVTTLSANFTCVHIARVEWRITLQEHDHFFRVFLRYFVAKTSNADTVSPRFLTLMHMSGKGGETLGSVQGSPLFNVPSLIFAALEHPLSSNGILRNDPSTAVCGISEMPQQARKKFSRVYSLSLGVYSEPLYGRRAFAQYVERIRSRPARTFLHYNSWFDFVSWQEPLAHLFPHRVMNETTCFDRVQSVGSELVRKRGVVFDSFLWDDGWDNHSSLWSFHQGFPQGFTPVKSLAKTYGSGCGVWMSPWGGYGSAKWSRMMEGQKHGYEINDNGFSLSGPKYFQRFREIALQMVTRYAVNMFKFDGVNFRSEEGGSYVTEVEAMMRLLVQLRKEAEDLFINLTTGTWPSPFWLLYADSIWRGYGDLGLFGHGSARQQWLTYRDSVVYALVVRRAQMFPLHALMLHGIVVGAVGESRVLGLDKIPSLRDFSDEVWSYFAYGVYLQELYLSPDKMTPAAWDVVAEVAQWARGMAPVFVDTHWIGGNPIHDELYGTAAFANGRGMVFMRNPSNITQVAGFHPGRVLELPADTPPSIRLLRRYTSLAESFVQRIYFEGKDVCGESDSCVVDTKTRYAVRLQPLEVLVMEAVPIAV